MVLYIFQAANTKATTLMLCSTPLAMESFQPANDIIHQIYITQTTSVEAQSVHDVHTFKQFKSLFMLS